MLDCIIRGGKVVVPEGPISADVGIADGRIAAIGDLSGLKTVREQNAEGMLVLPAVVDAHVHFNDPGLTEREDFYSGTAASAAGGVGTVVEMPLSGDPTVMSVVTLEKKKGIAAQKAVIDYGLWGGLVNDNTDELAAMSEAGALAFKAFTCFAGNDFPYATPDVLWRGLQQAARHDLLVGVHCEDEALTSAWEARAKAEGNLTVRSFLDAHGPVTEELAVNMLLTMARHTGARVHVVHATLPSVVDAVAAAKSVQPVTVETCPHYLIFTDTDVERLGGELKCTPPIRDQKAQDGLWERVFDGRIDMICSDHSPSTVAQKNPPSGNFWDAWGGTEGVQTMLSLIYGEGVVRRGLPLSRMAELLSAAPARVFGLGHRKGRIVLGLDADIVLFDPNIKWTVTEDALFYKNRHSPYMGMELQGRVKATFVRGQKVFDGQKISVEPGYGHIMTRHS